MEVAGELIESACYKREYWRKSSFAVRRKLYSTEKKKEKKVVVFFPDRTVDQKDVWDYAGSDIFCRALAY